MEPQGAHAFQSGSFRLAAAEIRHAAARPDRGPFDPSRLPPPGGPHLFARHLPLDSGVRSSWSLPITLLSMFMSRSLSHVF